MNSKSSNTTSNSHDQSTNNILSSPPSSSSSKQQTQQQQHTPYRSAGGRGTQSCSVQIPTNIQHFIPSTSSLSPNINQRQQMKKNNKNNNDSINNAFQEGVNNCNDNIQSKYKDLEYSMLSSKSLVRKERQKIIEKLDNQKINSGYDIGEKEDDENNNNHVVDINNHVLSMIEDECIKNDEIHEDNNIYNDADEKKMKKSSTTNDTVIKTRNDGMMTTLCTNNNHNDGDDIIQTHLEDTTITDCHQKVVRYDDEDKRSSSHVPLVNNETDHFDSEYAEQHLDTIEPINDIIIKKQDKDKEGERMQQYKDSETKNLNSIFDEAGLDFGSQNQMQWNRPDYYHDSHDTDSVDNQAGIDSVNSSGVSSITNTSAAASISTFGSSWSPGPILQKLDKLTSSANIGAIPAFTPKAKICDKVDGDKISSIESQSPLQIFKEVYSCESKDEAIELVLEQEKRLNSASTQLIDTLFQYLHKICGVPTEILFHDTKDFGGRAHNDNHVHTRLDTKIQNHERPGLALPASAIGWLASQLFSTQEDNQYFGQFGSQPDEELIVNSPKLSRGRRETLQRLCFLLAKNVTHLRVTGALWPPNVTTKKEKKRRYKRKEKMDQWVEIDTGSIISSLAYFRYLQNRPHIDMRLFPNLTYLHLEGVIPEYVTNLECTCDSLITLTIHQGYIVNVPNFLSCGTFSSLQHLKLTNCDINELLSFRRMDHLMKQCHGRRPPLKFMKELLSLDLSHNKFCDQEAVLVGLSTMTNLVRLDLSHNMIQSMDKAHFLLGNIQILNLEGNSIKNVSGIDHLYSLENLNLRNNDILTLADVSGLSTLPELMYICLKGNPLEKNDLVKLYRLKLLDLFKEARLDKSDKRLTFRDLIRMLPILDGVEITKKELVALKNLTFSQSIAVPIDDASDPVTEGLLSIYEPFRDDYLGPDGCTLAASIDMNHGQRPTIRKSRRKIVSIIQGNKSSEGYPLIESLRERRRILKKKTKMKSKNPRISDMYPTLENVLKSMIINKRERRTNGESNEEPSLEENDQSMEEVLLEESDKNVVVNQYSVESEFILNEIDAALEDPIILYKTIECCLEHNDESKKNGSATSKETNNITESKVIDIMNRSTDADISINKDSSIGDHQVESSKLKSAHDKLLETFNFAVAERTSSYDGPDEYSNLLVSTYLELYFNTFVFPPSSLYNPMDGREDSNPIQQTKLPRIQLYQTDRDLMMWTLAQKSGKGLNTHLQDTGEQLIALSCENIIPCGMAATGRIAPTESESKGIRGGTLFYEGKPLFMSEGHDMLLCISNTAIYLIPNTVQEMKITGRQFPAPIPSQAKFEEAIWPHAYCRHPLKFLKKIKFDGFGFQRLTLFFKLPSLRGDVYVQPQNGLFNAFDYTYVILTSNQHRTIELMQTLQRCAREVASSNGDEVNDVKVENDDNNVVSAIDKTFSNNTFNDDILHYQILTQVWHTNDTMGMGSRRAFILTNDRVCLFHETYSGDGSGGTVLVSDDNTSFENGQVMMRSIARSKLSDVSDVSILNEDSRKVCVNVKAKSGLRRSIQWILQCKDSENAERLIRDVRKAMSNNDNNIM